MVLVTAVAAVAALPAAGGDRASSLSVKLIYPENGAQVPYTVQPIKLTYTVTGNCKLGDPFVDPYWKQKGARGWGGTGASDEHSANFYFPLPPPGGSIVIQWVVHAVCDEDVRTGADRDPGSGKGVDSEIRTFYLASTAPATSVVKISALASGLQFNAKLLRAHPGRVEIVFTNLSMLQHNVRIKSGSKRLGGTKTIGRGRTTVYLTLKKGTYTFYCSVPGHEAAGMKGKLIVA